MNVRLNGFEFTKDVLVYIACATHPVSTLEIRERVVDCTHVMINRDLRDLVDEGYLIGKRISNTNFFTATDKTKQLFGIKLEKV